MKGKVLAVLASKELPGLRMNLVGAIVNECIRLKLQNHISLSLPLISVGDDSLFKIIPGTIRFTMLTLSKILKTCELHVLNKLAELSL